MPSAKQIPVQETAPETTLVLWSNDYAIPKKFGEIWHETAMFEDTDGNFTLITNIAHNTEAPQEGAIASPGDYVGRSADYSRYEEARTLKRIFDTPVGDALRLLGYDVFSVSNNSDSDNSTEVKFLGLDSLNDRLDTVREATGFALTAVPFEGERFRSRDLISNLEKGSNAIAAENHSKAHDMLNHGVVWFLAGPSLISKITENGRERLSNVGTGTERSPLEVKEALDEYDNYFGTIEISMSAEMLLSLGRAMNGDKTAYEHALHKINSLITGSNRGQPTDEARAELDSLMSRVKQIGELYQETA